MTTATILDVLTDMGLAVLLGYSQVGSYRYRSLAEGLYTLYKPCRSTIYPKLPACCVLSHRFGLGSRLSWAAVFDLGLDVSLCDEAHGRACLTATSSTVLKPLQKRKQKLLREYASAQKIIRQARGVSCVGP